jgi:REP element-mobilizing transposase RayT
MQFYNKSIYHVYNQGNNRQKIFFERNDYLRFLQKINVLVKPNCDLLAYCLMPNHFHILIQTTYRSLENIKVGNIDLIKITNSFRLLLSEFAKEVNVKYNRNGSLFRQKTQFKLVDNGDPMYPKNVIKYVLANPLEARLVSNLDDCPYSSFLDMLGKRNGKLCDFGLCKEVFQLTVEDLKDIGNGYDDILYLKEC